MSEALMKKRTKINTPHTVSPSLPPILHDTINLAWRTVSRPSPFLHCVKVADSLPLSTSLPTFTILSF